MFKEKRVHIFALSNGCLVILFVLCGGHYLLFFARLTAQRYNKSLTYTNILAKKSNFFEFFR
jgi:hypothetical protein